MSSNLPPPIAAAAAPVQQLHHHYHQQQKSAGIAAALEVVPGLFQIFGIGHIYAGNVGTGLLFMFGYWAVALLNLLLCFIYIGLITWPLCWIATVLISSLTAANSCRSR